MLTIPDHAQGAAIGGGGLWIARSDWGWGTLDRLDPSTGAPQRRYDIAPGTEALIALFQTKVRVYSPRRSKKREVRSAAYINPTERSERLFFGWCSA